MPTRRSLSRLILAGSGLGLAASLAPRPAAAASRAEIDAEVAAALVRLRGMSNAAPLLQRARAELIFPRIISGGFIVGGQYGEGALLQGGRTLGYYSIAGVSLGFLAGAQAAGLAMLFMNEEGLRYLQSSDGWQIGTGPAVVVLDRGVEANLTSTTVQAPVYAITFNQEGLMASLALEGTKISHINPGT
jgi:lipid-binding SYLF domain-containing protein